MNLNNKTEEKQNRNLNLDEDDDVILEKTNLEKLRTNDYIMNCIKNNKLKKIIKHINSTKYKKKTLEKMLEDSDFRKFTDEILKTLGFLENDTFFSTDLFKRNAN